MTQQNIGRAWAFPAWYSPRSSVVRSAIPSRLTPTIITTHFTPIYIYYNNEHFILKLKHVTRFLMNSYYLAKLSNRPQSEIFINVYLCNIWPGFAIIAKYPFIFPAVRGALNHAWFCFCAFVQCLGALLWLFCYFENHLSWNKTVFWYLIKNL